MDKAIDHVTQACHHCASLRLTPTVRVEQSSCHPLDAVGVYFAADVIKRSRQLVLVLRQCMTSSTVTILLEDECLDTLQEPCCREGRAGS